MNELEAFDAREDREAVRARLRSASRRFYSILWQCFLIDLCLVFLWLFVAIAPIISSSGWLMRHLSMGSVAVLTLSTAALPLAVSGVRLVCVLQAQRRGTLRVDLMINAPRTLRQVAYLQHAPSVARWAWLGYGGSLAYALLNLLFIFLWSAVFGLAIGLSLLLYGVTLLSAVVVFTSTQRLYNRGVQHNVQTNVLFGKRDEEQWARVRAAEVRSQWRSV